VLTLTPAGLACPAGGFWIDPAGAVETAVVTHAHADHARPGSGVYYCAAEGCDLLARRMPEGTRIVPLAYGEVVRLGAARVSLHPAGHVRGSAQVRVEVGDEVWVASGDYKRQSDPTCSAFEVVACDVFITEATFALPIYRWAPTETVVAEVAACWRENAAAGRASILCTYALGKAQRLLAELARLPAGSLPEARGGDGPRVVLHGAVGTLTEVYRTAGVEMLPTTTVGEEVGRGRKREYAGALVVAPPSALGTAWSRRFGADASTAFASGWMLVRGVRRRRGFDRGFVLSDHADWPDLLRTIRETGARRVLATHGSGETLARYLREQGMDASALGVARDGVSEDES
jgi:putative mRNA 3-end processing factor